MTRAIILNKRPIGMPIESDFKMIDFDLGKVKEQQVKIKTHYVSVDPYLRGRMSLGKSYVAPFEIGKPIESGIIGEITESKHADYAVGDFVSGMLAWQEEQIVSTNNLMKVDANKAPLSTYLGILGMTGITAYLGLLEIGKPQEGETLVVSGAAGAVGSVVGQIGKIKGCRVVGIAGSDEKAKMLKEKFGYDEVVNYKTTENMTEAIAKACPNGVDVYFDNVGGDITDAVVANINKFARIPLCGNIALYNETELPIGPRIQIPLLKNSVLMQGFIVFDFIKKYPEAVHQLSQWLKEEKLTYEETVIKGFNNIPEAFIGLFEGKNKGKMLVKM